MQYDDKNLAYDLSLFESSSKRKNSNYKKDPAKEKLNQEKKADVITFVNLDKKDKAKVEKKKNPAQILGYATLIMLTAGLIIMMLCGQAELTELNQKISEAETVLNEKESIYIQTEMKVEAELSPETVEYYATNVLGMVKTDNSKKEFIRLSEGDQAEIAQKETGTFGQIISDKWSSIWE